MHRVEIPSPGGDNLAGIIELPADQPRHWALFAHCFTCSKDSLAAARVSRALAAEGVGVLRVDFTGIGESEGDFGETSFSSNLADIETAAAFMRERYGAVELLVGHSLGGAAVLAVAPRLPEVRAVATIAAPSDPAHVEHLFAPARAEIEDEGSAEVDLGGRPFCIRRSFVDDLRTHDLQEIIGGLDRALLVMHSPIDTMVSIDHAAAIFQAARHPRSFVSLDDADHLLTRREDAEYAAGVLAAWAARYVGSPESGAPEAAPETDAVDGVVVRERGDGRFTQAIRAGRHRMVADEPARVGGDDRGPDPYGYLLAALGACTAMTLRMYADRKELPLEGVEVALRHDKRHVEDCAECDDGPRRLDHIEVEIGLAGELDESQRQRMLEIAARCPVYRTLTGEVRVQERLVE